MPNPVTIRRVLANAAPSGTDPVVSAWSARVVANGGAQPSSATVTAINTFYTALVSAGISSKMKHINCMAPDSITAALTPLIVGTGNNPWINVGGCSVGVGGLATGGNTQYVKSGFNPVAGFSSDNDVGFSAYNPSAPATASDSLGLATDGGNFFGRFGTSLIGCYAAWAPAYGGGTPCCPPGFHSTNRVGSTTINCYEANSGTAFNLVATGAGSGTRPNFDVWFGTWNNAGSPANGQHVTYSFAAFHQGLTSSEAHALYDAVQAMRVSFGGGFA